MRHNGNSASRCQALAVIALSVTALFAGCATQPAVKSVERKSPVEDRLQQSAGSIERLLTELVMLERSRAGLGDFKPPSETLPADDPLQKRVSFVWTGEARSVVSRLAQMAGVSFEVEGKSPQKYMVSLDAHDQPLANILESVGTQLGNSAQIVYRPGGVAEGVIVLRYR